MSENLIIPTHDAILPYMYKGVKWAIPNVGDNKETHNLAMDDSIMFATAKAYEARLWTLDSDFNDFPDVNYYSKSNNQSLVG